MSENNGNDVFITLVRDNDCDHKTVERKIDEKQLIKDLKEKKDDKLFDLGIFVNEKGVAISTTFLKKKLQENEEKEKMLQIVGEIYDIMGNNESVAPEGEENNTVNKKNPSVSKNPNNIENKNNVHGKIKLNATSSADKNKSVDTEKEASRPNENEDENNKRGN